ncbi:hypothetical protein ABZV94_27705, partial [Streptomyces sp. NPDC004658]
SRHARRSRCAPGVPAARRVQSLVGAWGEAAVPALACGTAALALLWHAGRTLTQASAHAPTGAPD